MPPCFSSIHGPFCFSLHPVQQPRPIRKKREMDTNSSSRQVILQGGLPWGFRIQGGSDTGVQLRIARVSIGITFYTYYLFICVASPSVIGEKQSGRTGVPRPSTFVIYSRTRSSNKQPVVLVSTFWGKLVRDGFIEPERRFVNGF